MTWVKKKKVEIVADEGTEEKILEIVEREGATGYTIVREVGGKGHRGQRDSGDIFDVFRNVIVIVIAEEATARRIAKTVLDALENHPRIVYLSDVDVLRGEHFP